MLHNDKVTFEQVILRVSESKGIAAEIIEKDYYVTLFLKRIKELHPLPLSRGLKRGCINNICFRCLMQPFVLFCRMLTLLTKTGC